jgi:hypothetical protein
VVRLHQQWGVDYQLWKFDRFLGLYLSIFTKRYYTKLGAVWDRSVLKHNSYGGNAVLYKIDSKDDKV